MNFGEFTIPYDHVVYKTQHTFVFVNIRPFLPYHILVCPLSKKQYLRDLDTVEYADLFDTVRTCIYKLQGYGTSFTVSVQDGPEAGQSVPHVHVHIIPRNKGDIEDNDMIYAKGALDIVRNDRSYEEMADEAKRLRKLFV